MVYSGILFILFCTVDWLDVEGKVKVNVDLYSALSRG